MSYGRDRDAHHRGVGAVAAADHLRMRARKRKRMSRATRARDAQLAGLTYGRTGGLAGFGHLESLGAIKLSNVGVRTQTVVRGGLPDAPPGVTTNPYGGAGARLGNRIGTMGPLGPTSTPTPPLMPMPAPGGLRNPAQSSAPVFQPIVVAPVPVVPSPGVTTGGTLCSAAQALLGQCTPSGSTSSSSGSSGDGGGAGINSGGDSGLPTMTPPPDVPDAPDTSSDVMIAGYAIPKTALLVGGAAALYLLLRRKR